MPHKCPRCKQYYGRLVLSKTDDLKCANCKTVLVPIARNLG